MEDKMNIQVNAHDDTSDPNDFPSGIDLSQENQKLPDIEEDKEDVILSESEIHIEGFSEESDSVDESDDKTQDELDIKHPSQPDPSIFYLEEQEISAYCITQRGESHIRKGMFCQDWSGIRVIEDRGIIISAIADGVGSCALSDMGAECAVNRSLSVCETALRDGSLEVSPKEMGALLRRAMNEAYDAVEVLADENEVLPYSFQSTLTLAVYDGSDLYMGHAGDDGIVVITEDGGCHLATVRHKGEEMSSVFPLQSKATWQFGMASHIAAYFMCTDGVLDGFVRNETENNRVYYPFIEKEVAEPIHDYYSVERMCNERDRILCSPGYRDRVEDDLTFVSVVNQRKMADTRTKIAFDRNAWESDSEKYQQERIEKVRELERKQSEELERRMKKVKKRIRLSWSD